jgi:kexin
MTPTADEGWFSDMKNLSSNQRWVGGALAIAFLFLAGAGIFFWRRRAAARRRRAQYASVAGDTSVPMRSRGTKELYDAFGEVSDDDDDADEETGLRPRGQQPLGVHEVGYHSGFLDDEDAHSEAGYRDEPVAHAQHHAEGSGGSRLSGSESPDGSWAHASQTR